MNCPYGFFCSPDGCNHYFNCPKISPRENYERAMDPYRRKEKKRREEEEKHWR